MRPHQLLSLLALSALALGCAAQTGPAPSAAGAPRNLQLRGDFKGPLGIQLYSLRREMAQDVPGTLRRVRELGFQEVELAGTYNLTPAQFKQELDRAGLTPTAMHVGYERLRDDLPGVIQEAKTLGAPSVGVAWIPHPNNGPISVAVARQAAADFNRWGRALREQGIRFFYHIHGYEFQPENGVVPMDVLMQETDADAVKFEIDVFWAALPGQDPAALIRKYPNRWELMHIKDMRQGVARNVHSGSAPPDETEVSVGSGQIDWRAVLRAAQEVGLDRYYIEDEVTNPIPSITRSIQFLENLRF